MSDSSTHAASGGPNFLHDAREGKCGASSCNYRDNTPAPSHPAWKGKGDPMESHHIVCVATVRKYATLSAYKDSAETIEKIETVYKKTKWCVHKSENMIWLPLTGGYAALPLPAQSDVSAKSGWCLNLPCHERDHNPFYSFEVVSKLRSTIWDPIADSGEEEPHPTAEAVQLAFDNASKYFRELLVARGKRSAGAGTLEARRLADEKDAAKNEASKWWMAFSMGDDSIAELRRIYAFAQRSPVKGLGRKYKEWYGVT